MSVLSSHDRTTRANAVEVLRVEEGEASIVNACDNRVAEEKL